MTYMETSKGYGESMRRPGDVCQGGRISPPGGAAFGRLVQVQEIFAADRLDGDRQRRMLGRCRRLAELRPRARVLDRCGASGGLVALIGSVDFLARIIRRHFGDREMWLGLGEL